MFVLLGLHFGVTNGAVNVQWRTLALSITNNLLLRATVTQEFDLAQFNNALSHARDIYGKNVE
jgi:hypothetical protein